MRSAGCAAIRRGNASDLDQPFRRRLKADHAAAERRFAGARFSHQSDAFTSRDLDRDAFQRLNRTAAAAGKGLDQIAHADKRPPLTACHLNGRRLQGAAAQGTHILGDVTAPNAGGEAS